MIRLLFQNSFFQTSTIVHFTKICLFLFYGSAKKSIKRAYFWWFFGWSYFSRVPFICTGTVVVTSKATYIRFAVMNELYIICGDIELKQVSHNDRFVRSCEIFSKPTNALIVQPSLWILSSNLIYIALLASFHDSEKSKLLAYLKLQ